MNVNFHDVTVILRRFDALLPYFVLYIKVS